MRMLRHFHSGSATTEHYCHVCSRISGLLPFIMNTPVMLPLLVVLVSCTAVFSQDKAAKKSHDTYSCMPCVRDCDKIAYDKPGSCPHCGMELVKKATVIFGSIEPERLCDYITMHPDVVLLDVRSRDEFEGRSRPDYGTLKNAVNIPIQELDSRLGELGKYKDKEIIVYCSHSQRSSQASYLLVQNGFGKVTNMAKGLRALKDKTCLR